MNADDDASASFGARFAAKLGAIGPLAQAAIPGFYAWIVSVVPVAWDHAAPWYAKGSALAGALSLLVGAAIESAVPRIARATSAWGLVGFSALTWIFADANGAMHVDASRGLAAALGWGLFALASAAPSLPRDPDAASRLVAGPPLRSRAKLPQGDGAYLLAGAVAAIALQAIGWDVISPERAVLVRLIAVASGLAVIAAATSLATSRHSSRAPARPKIRMRRALPWIALILLVLVGGALLFFAR